MKDNMFVAYGKMGEIDPTGMYGKISESTVATESTWRDISGDPIKDTQGSNIILMKH